MVDSLAKERGATVSFSGPTHFYLFTVTHMWILINFVDYILKCNILGLNKIFSLISPFWNVATLNFKHSYVAHIVFLLDSTGLADFLGPFKGFLHPASLLTTDHSSASPYRISLGTGRGDRATEASIIMEGDFNQCVPEWLQPFQQWPHSVIPPELVASLRVFPPAVLLLLSPVCSILIFVAIIDCLALCDFDTHPV